MARGSFAAWYGGVEPALGGKVIYSGTFTSQKNHDIIDQSELDNPSTEQFSGRRARRPADAWSPGRWAVIEVLLFSCYPRKTDQTLHCQWSVVRLEITGITKRVVLGGCVVNVWCTAGSGKWMETLSLIRRQREIIKMKK